MDEIEQAPTRRTRSRVRADGAQRALRAWHLRVQGESWEAVASSLGFANRANARRCVKNYLGELPVPDREDMCRLIRARHEVLWHHVVDDADAGRPGAVRAGVAVLRSASQLDGLDEATKLEVTPDAVRFEQVVQRVVAAQRAEPEALEADVVESAEIDGTDWGAEPADEDDEPGA